MSGQVSPRRCALVAGDLGLVGSYLLDALDADGWDTTGVARGAAAARAGNRHRHLRLDLGDAAACATTLASQADRITHVFFAARASDPDPDTESRINLAMLQNLLEPLDRSGSALAHVALVHGSKWYGSHLGPYPTPAREDDPRCMTPVYYYAQQDEIVRRQAGKTWTWSTVRPHIVLGVATGYPYNCVTMLGAYGSLCAELGVPLSFPGSRGSFDSVSQATDAGLLARALIWSGTSRRSRNEAYNVINGDYFRWCNLWPRLADFFRIPAGPVRTVSLSRNLRGAAPVWERIVARHGLQSTKLGDLANWEFADFLFAACWDDMSSIVKLRQHGFHETVATEEVILGHLADMRASRLIP